jgi:hypothetical protein
MDFDVQIVLSATQVIFSGSDPEIEHADRAPAAVLQQTSGLRFEKNAPVGATPLPLSCVRDQYADNHQKTGGNSRMPKCAHRFLLV